MALEEAATKLVDAGCVALVYDEELASNGTLLINVHIDGSLHTALRTAEGVQTESDVTVADAEHVLREVETVTFNGQTYPFWADISDYGIETLGRRPLYIHRSVASDHEYGYDEHTLDEGLALAADILTGGE